MASLHPPPPKPSCFGFLETLGADIPYDLHAGAREPDRVRQDRLPARRRDLRQRFGSMRYGVNRGFPPEVRSRSPTLKHIIRSHHARTHGEGLRNSPIPRAGLLSGQAHPLHIHHGKIIFPGHGMHFPSCFHRSGSVPTLEHRVVMAPLKPDSRGKTAWRRGR